MACYQLAGCKWLATSLLAASGLLPACWLQVTCYQLAGCKWLAASLPDESSLPYSRTFSPSHCKLDVPGSACSKNGHIEASNFHLQLELVATWWAAARCWMAFKSVLTSKRCVSKMCFKSRMCFKASSTVPCPMCHQLFAEGWTILVKIHGSGLSQTDLYTLKWFALFWFPSGAGCGS